MSVPAHLLLLICVACAAGQTEIFIGVTEPDPLRGQQLAAAVAAALGGRAPGAPPAPPVEPDEPLAVPAHICSQARAGAMGVALGGGALAAALGCEAGARAGLPLLLLDDGHNTNGDALAMHPHPTVLAQVCSELCEAKGWRRAVFLYEGSAAGAALIAPDSAALELLPRMLPPPRDEALLRNLLLLLKKSGAMNFIVWCSAACCARVLDAAQRVGLLADTHSYILLTLDLHTQALEPYSHGGANITSVTEPDPLRGQQLAAAVAAALGGRAPGAPPAPPVEPDEPLAVPAHICSQVILLCNDDWRGIFFLRG
nr:unnamed protein product [Amyelois transitella]